MKVMMLVHEKIITTFFQEPLENNVIKFLTDDW